VNNQLIPAEYNNQRILTTQQVADFFGTTPNRIIQNFNRNKDRYVLGKDYYILEGEELKKFKDDDISKRDFVESDEIDDTANCGSVNRVNKLLLWTEWGCLLHTKSLNTNEAWNVFFDLRTSYFQIQQIAQSSQLVTQETAQLQTLENMVSILQEEIRILSREVRSIRPPESEPVSREELKMHILEAMKEMEADYPEGMNAKDISAEYSWFALRNYPTSQIFSIMKILVEQGLIQKNTIRTNNDGGPCWMISHSYSLPNQQSLFLHGKRMLSDQ